MEPTTLYLLSLGCSKNQVDSEVILGALMESGYRPIEDFFAARLILVNTCAFIKAAAQESIDAILELAQAKDRGQCQLLVVAGCLPQRYGRKLARALPEVDLFVGTSSFRHLPAILCGHQPGDPQQVYLEPPCFLMNSSTSRVLSAPFYTAYIKIAEGCDNSCTFCTIPAIRGRYRSRPLEDLLSEAQWLPSQGVRELNLVAQDTGAYGMDLGGNHRLHLLLDALAATGQFSSIRLLYTYPHRVNHELLQVMNSHPCICNYLDLPFQHASARVLRAMGRSGSGESFRQLIASIREYLPELTLRTTLMVGFPGETEDDFQELWDFVAQVRFHRLGIFAYSAEKGTAAARFGDPVPETVKQERLQALAALQASISLDHQKRLVGTIQPVLVEGASSETELLLEGRLPSQAPSVDGRVLINKGYGQVGEIMPVKITHAYTYDLIGEIIASD
ncbi:MAG: 30S ribosomal protein S12 methylthiotransferase RimO [Syntrophobacteria bacterium]